MSKLRIPLLIAIEAVLLVFVIIFWGSIASVLFAVGMIFPLAAILSSKSVRDGRTGNVDDLDPVKLAFRKHRELTGLDSEDEE